MLNECGKRQQDLQGQGGLSCSHIKAAAAGTLAAIAAMRLLQAAAASTLAAMVLLAVTGSNGSNGSEPSSFQEAVLRGCITDPHQASHLSISARNAVLCCPVTDSGAPTGSCD